jgi:cytochrome c biogenesis protein CcmG, thiol:disulfide interchange protein DsbE
VNRKVLIVGLLVVVPLVVFLAFGFRYDPHAIDSPLVGRPAPDFALQELNGGVLRSAELRGRPALINFWATWCQPCVVEHPILQAAAHAYADRVSFVGVIYQDDPSLIRRFLQSRGGWGETLIDTDSQVALAYGVYGAPETFIVDAQGTVVDKIVGPVEPERLRRRFNELLGER